MGDLDAGRGEPLGRGETLVTLWSPYCHEYATWSPGSSCGASRGGRAVSEEVLDAAKESRGLRLRVLGRQAFEFLEQFALLLGQALRRLDHDLHVHVAHLLGAEHRHALGLKAETA